MKKHFLSIIMAAAMVLSLLPASALAVGAEANVAEVNGTGYPTLQAAFDNAQDGDTIKLLADVTLDPLYAMDEEEVEDAPIRSVITVTSDITLDLDSHEISWDSKKIPGENEPEIWYTLCFFVVSGADVKITGNGNGTIDVEAGNNNSYGINITNNGSVTVENGTYTGATTAIQVQEGSLTILGGTFEQAETIAGQAPGYAKYVINCIDANFKNGTARIYVKGGTFCFDPDGKPENSDVTYVPVDYESNANEEDGTWTVTAKGSIGVDKPSSGNISDGTVDATVGGVTVPSDSSNQVVVDAAVENASDVTTANVTVGGDALTAVKEAANVSSLAIKTNVGTLTISDAALDTIITKATDGSSVADVTLSIAVDSEKTTDNSVTYDFTATDARGVEVFDQTASEDAIITVTVDAPEGAAVGENVYIYYIDGDTRTLEATRAVAEGGTVTWDVTHFSSREITKDMDEATYTNSKGNEVTGTLAEAVENAKENTTITLNRDVTLTAPVDVAKQVTLDLNGHQITNAAEGGYTADYLVSVKRGGDLTIEDNSSEENGAIITSGTIPCGVKMTILGENDDRTAAKLTVDGGTIQGETYGIAGNGTRHNTEITINDGIIRAESDDGTGIYHPQDGSLTVNGGSITGNTGIEIRSGSLTVTGGTITGGNEEPAVVTNGDGTTTSNTGIAIAQHTTEKPITVSITGGEISGSAAVYESNPQKNDGTAAVSVTIEDVTLNGDLNSSGFGTVTVDNTTIDGDVDKAGTGSMSVIESTITGNVTKKETDSGSLGFVKSTIEGENAPAADANGVTYVDTTVNGKDRDTVLTGKVAMIGGTTYGTLAEAIDDATDGQTIVLLAPITNDNYGTADTTKGNTMLYVDKSVTIAGNGKSITLTIPTDFGNDDQAIGVAEGKTLTLNGVTLTVTGGEEDKRGDGFDVWANATLEITNGSNVTLNGLRSAFTMQGGDSTKLVVENSTVTANNIHGNFSNGGALTFDNATVDINGCDSYGISANTITTTGNTTITADNVAYSAIYGYTEITFNEGTQVTVTNCTPTPYFSEGNYGDATAPIQMKVKHTSGSTENNKTEEALTTPATLTVSKGATVTVSGSETGIYLPSNVTYTNNGTVNATVVTAEVTGNTYNIIYTVNGQTYYTVTAKAVSGTITYPAPADPTDLGSYRFDGWDYGNVTVSGPDASGNVTITVDSPAPTNNTYTFAADLTYTGGSSGGSTRYAVTVPSNVSNGTVTVSPSRASYNQTVTITVTPDEGYELSSLTVTDRNGSTISLTKVSDTRYTFTMPRSAVTISASFAEEQLVSSLPFTDVSVDDWFYDMVEYVYDNGIMTGTSGTTFEPNATLTRAMMATVLWAMEGNPTSGSGSYTDVSSGDWYYNAVRWATSAGVVNGVGDNTFAPNDPLTREQMAVMLYAYAVYKGYDTAASTAAESFSDSGEISGWALTAMNWAVDNGLLGGKPGNLLDPTGSATRAEIATILRNFCENIVK